MAKPNEKLAASLGALRKLQKGGRRVFRSGELSRVHRERLLKNGFLREIMKGWLMSANPDARPGDSTPWYASFWEFCARYCTERFGAEWYLSPEQSLLLHAESTVIPAQIVVYSPKGTNNTQSLPFDTSIYDLKQPVMPHRNDVSVHDGLRLFSPAAALTKVTESFFARHPIETRIVLASIRDASEVLGRLLDGAHTVIAGRLAGAFRRIGRADAADDILGAMRAAGHDVRENDPFSPRTMIGNLPTGVQPVVGRLQAMWEAMRDPVIAAFPAAPGLPRRRKDYLRIVDEIYKNDAYHSLSIEGYRVTPELIERVQSGEWNPNAHESDRQSKDALAARGYWQAFIRVKADIGEIIGGANPGTLIRATHREWYRELFQPCVTAGLIPAAALAGYRTDAVFLRTSRYVPPRWKAISHAMPALFDLLAQESEPSVRAVLGHWLFGYVHPYFDGNGRMARFMMNAMLSSGGYPWTVIRIEDRADYLSALDRASIDQNIGPFAAFLAERVRRSMDAA